jgi:tetratricopeptide (TPR) repeat protein
LALLYFVLGAIGIMPAKAANAQCSQAVHKALALDEMLPEAHGMVGVLWAAEFDWAGAEKEFRRAQELGPEVSFVWSSYSLWYLVPMRRLDEAVAASRKALELDPLSPAMHHQLGAVHYTNGQYDLAIEQQRNALELDPNFHMSHIILCQSLTAIGKFDEAVSAIETAAQFLGFIPMVTAERGDVYARAGRIGDARKVLDELQKLALRTNVPAPAFAIVYLGLGEIDTAFDWLDKAVEERNAVIIQIIANPLYERLRSHPRYHALMRKMNLAP